ncbi:MAG: hypothetical protein ABIO45_14960 [Burkholderiaceae bacterium]
MKSTRWNRSVLVAALAILCSAQSAFAAELASNETAIPDWARWQGRVSLGLTAPAGRTFSLGTSGPGLQADSLSVLGDYYFGDVTRARGYAGGFRATSGVIVGSRSPLWSGQASLSASRGLLGVERKVTGLLPVLPSATDLGAETSAVPYFGVGYTGLSVRSNWSFSADLGMVARSPGSMVKLGRVFTGSQGVDDLLRELRLAPMLQLGVSYSF